MTEIKIKIKNESSPHRYMLSCYVSTIETGHTFFVALGI